MKPAQAVWYYSSAAASVRPALGQDVPSRTDYVRLGLHDVVTLERGARPRRSSAAAAGPARHAG